MDELTGDDATCRCYCDDPRGGRSQAARDRVLFGVRVPTFTLCNLVPGRVKLAIVAPGIAEMDSDRVR